VDDHVTSTNPGKSHAGQAGAHIGLGSDFDGGVAVLFDAAGMGLLTAAML
jgi:hypothetical protein